MTISNLCRKRFHLVLTVVGAILPAVTVLAADPPAEKSAGRVQFRIDEPDKQMPVLVHRGDAKVGKVAERYEEFVKGNLP